MLRNRSDRPVARPAAALARAIRVTVVAVVAGSLTAASCSSGDGNEADAEPTCDEARLASGNGYPWDPGLALAVARQIEVTHPELSGVINAAADYQETHPTYQDFEDHRDGDVTGDGAIGFIGALLVLAERPDLATTGNLQALRQAASEGGMPAVGNLLADAGRRNPVPDVDASFTELADLTFEREQAVEEAHIVSLPDPRCPPDDGAEG